MMTGGGGMGRGMMLGGWGVDGCDRACCGV